MRLISRWFKLFKMFKSFKTKDGKKRELYANNAVMRRNRRPPFDQAQDERLST